MSSLGLRNLSRKKKPDWWLQVCKLQKGTASGVGAVPGLHRNRTLMVSVEKEKL